MTQPPAAGARALPPSGPLEQWPQVSAKQAAGMLKQGLSGLDLGRVDHAVRAGLVGLDPAMPAVVASWLRRTFEAGVAAGRAEVVDETPTVQAAYAEAQQAQVEAEQAQGRAEAWGRVVDDVVTAAVDAGPVVEDDTADARAALRTLLARIEQAADPLTEDGRR